MGPAYDFLFVADGKLNFIMTSLMGNLEKKGMIVGKCDINMKSLENIESIPEMFVIDAASLVEHTSSRTYIYDLCIANSKKIILIGDQSELTQVYDMTAANVIGAAFKHPINNIEVTDKLQEMLSDKREHDQKKRILVVDDSPAFLRIMAEWLEKDYNANICPSATAAFHMIEVNKPDLILLDYEMPVCNGAQFLQMLHSEKATAEIPVIFLTGRDDTETVRSLIALKPQGYLLKNQTKDATLKAIEAFFIKEMMK